MPQVKSQQVQVPLEGVLKVQTLFNEYRDTYLRSGKKDPQAYVACVAVARVIDFLKLPIVTLPF